MPHAIAGFFAVVKGIAATPGYFISDTPWAGTMASTTQTRLQSSGYLSGGNLSSENNLNADHSADHYFDAGTFKWAVIGGQGTSFGIDTLYRDASSIGTIDWYNASGANNIYKELTGLTFTAGLYTMKAKVESKNASSTGHYIYHFTQAFVRTGA